MASATPPNFESRSRPIASFFYEYSLASIEKVK